MKKHIIVIAAIFGAALLVAGCYPNENVDVQTKGLTVTLFSDEPETKADPTFETKITHFDYFFFTTEAGDDTNGPIYQGRVTGSSKTFETGLGKDFVKLRKVTSYLYVIANYPEELNHNQAWTLAELKALEFESKLVTATDNEAGTVTFCSDMVMDSYSKSTGKYTVELTPALVEETRTVSVGLTRIASKLVLNFTIPASVNGSMTGEGEKWTPVLKDLRAYYVNALNNLSTVGATPVQRSAIPAADVENYEYYSYPTNYPISPDPLTATATDGNYQFSTGAVYTYPQTWTAGENGEPYFKVQMTWRSNVRGTSNFYYKICVPKPGTDGKVTINRNTCYVVDVTLDVIDTENEYVVVNPANYTVQEWAVSAWQGGSGMGSARFFNVPKKSIVLYSNEYVDIPYSSNSAVTAFFKQIKFKFYGDSSGAIYEYTFNYSDEANKTSLTLNGTTDTEGHSVPAKARETTSTPYTITIPAGSKYVRFSHPLTGIFTERTITLRIKNQEGAYADVTITQHPAIELKTRSTSNAFVNGWFARANSDVRDADGNLMGVRFGPTQAFDSGQYRYHATSNWSGTYCTHFPQTGGSNPMDLMGYIFGDNSSTTVVANTVYMTEITVSAFNETNDHFAIQYRNSTTYNGGTGTDITRYYKVGDPRVPVSTHYPSFTLPEYLYSDATHRDDPDYTGGNKFQSWEDPLKILIASQNADANEVIAPRFLVSSALNYISSSIPHDGSMRRATCYQEAGYPAGRWRLPTEAEIAFIVARQKEGVIPELFAGTYYHCANGRLVYVAKNNTNPPISVEAQHGTATQVGCNRFVYDLWYWGDEPMDPSFYHANMHEH